MTDKLTAAAFAPQLNTKFRVILDTPQPVELELVEVKGYHKAPEEQGGMERFSLFFTGPADIQLSQHTYRMEHEQMGQLDIFIVPIARNEQGFRYEAVFNYFKQASADYADFTDSETAK